MYGLHETTGFHTVTRDTSVCIFGMFPGVPGVLYLFADGAPRDGSYGLLGQGTRSGGTSCPHYGAQERGGGAHGLAYCCVVQIEHDVW